MEDRQGRSGTRAAAAALATLAVPALGIIAGRFAWEHARTVDWQLWEVADALTIAAGALGAIVAAWFTVGVLATLVAHARGLAAPVWVGVLAKATAGALAMGLIGGSAYGTDREEVATLGWLRVPVSAAPSTAPSATPSPPPAPPETEPARPPATDTASTAASGARHDHTVRLGESLWSITAEALGESTTDSAIAAAWPVLYQHNRAVIGADPDMILPGTVLAWPVSLEGDRS